MESPAKTGSRFWANVVITALRDPEGNLHGFAKLTRDMTERREKEETLTKAKELLELGVETTDSRPDSSEPAVARRDHRA